MKKGFVRRKSDGEILKIIAKKGNEICVREYFSFWSPKGTIMKPLKIWGPMERYELE